jgi:hypothetical protein
MNAYTLSLIPRILDPNDRLRRYIRRLEIGPFSSYDPYEEDGLPPLLTSETIIQILHALTNLKDFGWNVCAYMPSDILTTLHQEWPRCRLHVKQLHRCKSRLDEDLIGSPQLVSLEMQLHQSVSAQKSDWPVLTKLLTRHKCLKVFRPYVLTSDWFKNYNKDLAPGPLQFQLEPDTRLPDFEDFTIPTQYHADQLHVDLLLRKMPWSSLRRLELGIWPDFLLQSITGSIPQLKSLSVLFRGTNMYPTAHSTANEATCMTFINSIHSLEEVSIYNSDYDAAQTLLLAVFSSQKKTLQRVKVDGPGWLPDDVIGIILREAPDIKQLSIPVGFLRLPRSSENAPQKLVSRIQTLFIGDKSDFPVKHQTLLNKLTEFIHLQSLDLSMWYETKGRVALANKGCIFLPQSRARYLISSIVNTFTDRLGNALEELTAICRTASYAPWNHEISEFTARVQPLGPPSIRIRKQFFDPPPDIVPDPWYHEYEP